MTVVRFAHRYSERNVSADVERCLRHRGVFSLSNYFVIGSNHAQSVFRIYLCPMSCVDKWQDAQELRRDNMVRWANGMLTRDLMPFWSCTDTDPPSVIPAILRSAFAPGYADERLEDFHQAEVSLSFLGGSKSLGTIAELIEEVR